MVNKGNYSPIHVDKLLFALVNSHCLMLHITMLLPKLPSFYGSPLVNMKFHLPSTCWFPEDLDWLAPSSVIWRCAEPNHVPKNIDVEAAMNQLLDAKNHYKFIQSTIKHPFSLDISLLPYEIPSNPLKFLWAPIKSYEIPMKSYRIAMKSLWTPDDLPEATERPAPFRSLQAARCHWARRCPANISLAKSMNDKWINND